MLGAMKTSRADIEPYVTKDGSLILELMHPQVHPPEHSSETGGGHLSLAEARVEPGASTMAHVHDTAEEIYHFTAGTGRMFLDGEEFAVAPGDTVRIEPGRVHKVHSDEGGPLVFLCCCAPPYAHDDTRAADGPEEGI